MATKIALIDDELHCIKELKGLLAGRPDFSVVAEISDPENALSVILETKPDLIFLDIMMPGCNGFELLSKMRSEGCRPHIIFVSAYDKYAIEAIKNSAFDYLLKPVTEKDMDNSLKRFTGFLSEEKQEPDYEGLIQAIWSIRKIRLNSAGGFVVLNLENIIYVEADWNYSKIYTASDKFEVVTLNIGSLEKKLPSDSFMRINRSIIINLKYLSRVRRLNRKCILTKDQEVYEFTIPLNRIRLLEKKLQDAY